MIEIPLYKNGQPDPAAINDIEPALCNKHCEGCYLAKNVRLRTRCLRPEGAPGGLLIVGESPGQNEDTVGRPFVGRSGKLLRSKIKEYWSGPIAIDNAVKCYPGKRKITAGMVGACRKYLAQTIREVQPTRIIALGAWASLSLWGRSIPPLSTRRAYGYITPTLPVISVIHPAAALRSRFVGQVFDRDLRWALTVKDLPKPPWSEVARVVENPLDMRQAVDELGEGGWVVIDVETKGKLFDDDFRLLSISCCSSDSESPFVFRPDIDGIATFLDYISKPTTKLVGQNIKYDQLAISCHYKLELTRNIHFDTRLARRLLEPQAVANLDVMSELVGMGGMKHAAKRLLRKRVDEIRKAIKHENSCCQPFFDIELKSIQEPEVYGHALLPFDELAKYNARDVVTTNRLAKLLSQRLSKEPELERTFRETVMPAAMAIAQVEYWGLSCSMGSVEVFDHYLRQKEEAVIRRLAKYSEETNWDSPKQVREVLYNQLGLEPVKETREGVPSTDKEALKAMRSFHPIIPDILEYRFISKMRDTYASGLLPHIRGDGRIHPSFHLDGTGTGRLSCSKPNCFDGETEVLTLDKGWLRIDRLRPAQLVAQWGDGVIDFVAPIAYIEQPCEQFVHIRNTHIDIKATPDHRCLLRRKGDGSKYVEFPASDYPTSIDWLQPHAGLFEGRGRVKGLGDCDLTDALLILLIAVQADGSWNDGGYDFQFKKLRKIERLEASLKLTGAKYSKRAIKRGGYKIRLRSCEATDRVREMLGPEKVFSQWILQLDREQLDWFCDEVFFWDGCASRNNHYASKDLRNANWVQIALTLSGRRARIRTYVQADGSLSYQVDVSKRSATSTNTVTIDRFSGGQSYCVSVPSSFLLIRRNFCTAIIGNCQNIPCANETSEGKQLRDCFVAPKGKMLIESDFSQLELRVAAMLSDDPVMKDIFTQGVDYHRRTAELIADTAWGIPANEITDVHRKQAKCFHPDTEVLTRRGWSRILELAEGEDVVGAFPKSDGVVDLRWMQPKSVFSEEHKSKQLIHVQGNGINLRVTPDHRMVGWDSSGQVQIVTPNEFQQLECWAGAGELKGMHHIGTHHQLAVAIFARGQLTYGCCKIEVSNDKEAVRLRCLLVNGGDFFSEIRNEDGQGSKIYINKITSDAASKWLAPTNDDLYNLSWRLPSADLETRREIFEEIRFWLSDAPLDWSTVEFKSLREEDADIIQAIAVSIGYKSRRSQFENFVTGWSVVCERSNLSSEERVRLIPRKFEDKVACIEVPSTFVLVRDKGVPVICGQTLNFAILYGAGDATLTKRLGCNYRQAVQIKGAVLGTFNRLHKWCKERLQYARRNGHAWTWWDGHDARRRPLWKIADASDEKGRSTAKNSSWNSPIQGTASDFCIRSLTKCVEWILDNNLSDSIKLVLTVHDSLLFECDEDKIEMLVEVVKRIMTSWPTNGVPLEVDMKLGRSWGSMEKI